jgi:hypothetical protein
VSFCGRRTVLWPVHNRRIGWAKTRSRTLYPKPDLGQSSGALTDALALTIKKA